MEEILKLLTFNNVVTLTLFFVLFFSKRFSRLRLTQVYLLADVVFSLVYRNIFHNWTFYQINNSVIAILFALAVWEIYKFATDKSLSYVWFTIVLIVLLPFMPLTIQLKSSLPFTIVNVFLVLRTFKAFESRNAMLIHLVIFNSLSFVIDAFKFLLPLSQVMAFMKFIEPNVDTLTLGGLVAIVAWQPARKYVHKGLHWMLVATSPKLVPVHGGGSGMVEPAAAMLSEPKVSDPTNIVRFPGVKRTQTASGGGVNPAVIESIKEDMETLEPVLKTAAQMVTLSKKPFLDRKELAFYLDMEQNEADTFIEKYKISKLFLTDGSEHWVVRRLDVDYLIEEEQV